VHRDYSCSRYDDFISDYFAMFLVDDLYPIIFNNTVFWKERRKYH
jgi:hypothetical protein